jgi:lipoate-protein ligase B
MQVEDFGTLRYTDAWALQEQAHEEVAAGGAERIILVEHPPVITLGRRPGIDRNLLASAEQLANLGVEVVQSDRGGDITFHGPGQIVAYPIVRLADHQFFVSSYVHALEDAIIAMLRDFKLTGSKDPKAVGVWVEDDGGTPAKVAAIGVRIRRGVSLHGLALNITTDLKFFDLIVPCGLVSRPVTSIQKLLGARAPSLNQVKVKLTERLEERFELGGVSSQTSGVVNSADHAQAHDIPRGQQS